MKLILGVMSLASGHHVRVKSLDFTDHDGGKVLTYGHIVGKNLSMGITQSTNL